jgi:hypothetical protein
MPHSVIKDPLIGGSAFFDALYTVIKDAWTG